VYPTLIRIGTFEITTFGALVAAGAMIGIWIFSRELKYSGLPASAVDAAIYGVIGGLIGAKLVWAIEFRHHGPFLSLLFSRGGLSWFGGFAGGVATGLWVLSQQRVPILAALSAAAPALAVGHAIGRLGCFMVGDDYGRPTDLPWGVAFPRGLPPTDERVHPTQLYEAIPLLGIAWVLVRWRRQRTSDADVFGRYLVLVGALRFAIEFIRVNLRIAGPLTLAHLVSAAVMTGGIVLLLRNHLQRRRMDHLRLVL
jgi:phosphatidylglycerol:prolipoprotein diacylglycerol transferase